MTAEWEKIRQEQEARRAASFQAARVEFGAASRRLQEHVAGLKPTVIIVGGDSSPIAEAALRGGLSLDPIDPIRIRKFEPDLNKALYGGYSAGDTEQEARELLAKYHPTIRKDGTAVFVDDSESTGEKARRAKLMLARLGFSDPRYAVLSANPEGYYVELAKNQDFFRASYDADLYRQVDMISRGLSYANRSLRAEKITPDQRRVSQRSLAENLELLVKLSR